MHLYHKLKQGGAAITMPRGRARPRRGTAGGAANYSLFDAIVSRAKQAGDLEDAEHILDFCRRCIPESDAGQEAERNPYNYDFVPMIAFGTNEGIYLSCYLMQNLNGQGMCSFRIGTMKTLSADQNACKIMGELCGTLMYHARRYMDEQFCGAPASWNSSEQD